MDTFEYISREESLKSRQTTLDIENEKLNKVFIAIGDEINIEIGIE